MNHTSRLVALIASDEVRWSALAAVRSLGLRDCWIAAGFVRDAVWDHLHGGAPSPPAGDVDVIWFDADDIDPDYDRALEHELDALAPDHRWSVKNQARMHVRNGDAPYTSCLDAMRCWPETATAVAARRGADEQCEIAAPFGLDDLFALRLAPTPSFAVRKRDIFDGRIAQKRWLTRYPLLQPPPLR